MTTQDYLDAIIPILRQRPDGMHIQDIIASLIGSGLVSPDDEKEHHRIQSIVSQKSKKKDSPFAHVINKKTKKPAKGMYKIRPVASSANKSKQRAIEPIQTPDVSTSYTGAGGEFLIMSELLFQGYNVNKMTVDDGEDIIARALEADPEVLVLYDVACRHYHNRGKAEEVVALGMKSFKCEGADTYRADILYYMKQALSDYGTINWDAGQLISSTALGAGINLDTFIPSRYIPFVDAEQCPTSPEATPQEPYPCGTTPTNF